MNRLNISDSTKEEMIKFFMRTSIPRILEERRKEEKQEGL